MSHEQNILLCTDQHRHKDLLRRLAAMRRGRKIKHGTYYVIRPVSEPTNQDIMDALTAMQGDQVPAAQLDAAYREGVNAYV